MFDAILGPMLAQSGLSDAQIERVQDAAADAVSRMSMFDMIAAAGQLMGAKAALDAGDQEAAVTIVRQLAEQHGLTDVIDGLVAEFQERPALPPGD